MRSFGTSQRRMIVTGILITLASGLVGILPVAAATPNYRPDGRVLQPCDPQYEDCQPIWFGDDVHNTTAFGQKVEYFDQQGVSYGGPVVFRIRIQNDGARADRIGVVATGSTSGYRVRFFQGATDITAAVNAGTYRTPRLAPGAIHTIKARVTFRSDPVNGDKAVRLVTLTSVGNADKKDAVKFVRRFSTCGC